MTWTVWAAPTDVTELDVGGDRMGATGGGACGGACGTSASFTASEAAVGAPLGFLTTLGFFGAFCCSSKSLASCEKITVTCVG